MNSRNARWLVVIAIILAFDLWVNWPGMSMISVGSLQRDTHLRQGLDLQGGIHLEYKADVSQHTAWVHQMFHTGQMSQMQK